MNAEALFQAVQSAAVVVGVGFAVYETRRYRRERNREAAMELLHAFQTPEFAKALVLVYRLPDGLSKEQVERSLGEDLHLVYAMTTTWESLGILLFRGEVSMELVDDFFSGPIAVSWRKLQRYFVDERRETGRETVGEWFQWLAERFEERERAEIRSRSDGARRPSAGRRSGARVLAHNRRGIPTLAPPRFAWSLAGPAVTPTSGGRGRNWPF